MLPWIDLSEASGVLLHENKHKRVSMEHVLVESRIPATWYSLTANDGLSPCMDERYYWH